MEYFKGLLQHNFLLEYNILKEILENKYKDEWHTCQWTKEYSYCSHPHDDLRRGACPIRLHHRNRHGNVQLNKPVHFIHAPPNY